jgi:hypothetical protein
MKFRSTFFTLALLAMMILGAGLPQARSDGHDNQIAPAPGKGSVEGSGSADGVAERVGTKSMMPASVNLNASESAFTITPMAATITGVGSTGRLAKWTSFSTIGDSTIFEDKFGKVGVGTDVPTSRLTVAGLVESMGAGGGIKFPDGSVQATAGVSGNQVVSSLNGLKGEVTLEAGRNITLTATGNKLTIAAPTQDPALSAFQAQVGGTFAFGFPNFERQIPVPANTRMVIEYVSVQADLSNGDYIASGHLTTVVNGIEAQHFITPLRLPENSATNFAIDKQVRIYADGGTNIAVSFQRTNLSSLAEVTITISGHLVDMP